MKNYEIVEQFEEEIQGLVLDDRLREAIALAEEELEYIDCSSFSKIIGKDLLHNVSPLRQFLTGFFQEQNAKAKSLIFELNEHSFFYDFILKIKSYEIVPKTEDIKTTLRDQAPLNSSSFRVQGFEDILSSFKSFYEFPLASSSHAETDAAKISFILLLLRLNELLSETIKAKLEKSKPWTKTPIFIWAGPYHLVSSLNFSGQ